MRRLIERLTGSRRAADAPPGSQPRHSFQEGVEFGQEWHSGSNMTAPIAANNRNLLREYFDGYDRGPGIWKWSHYFDVYDRYLKKFIGSPVSVVEIGVFSGGSLGMWKQYFGGDCHVHGIDIEPECRAYSGENISIHIGDQQSRDFWKRFRSEVPKVDVLIDDGGHTPEQQRVTLEEMLPYLSAGGVYVCEDIHGIHNSFAQFAAGLAMQLNQYSHVHDTVQRSSVEGFQRDVLSVHFYPYLVVIEKRDDPLRELIGPRKGTEWSPAEWTERDRHGTTGDG